MNGYKLDLVVKFLEVHILWMENKLEREDTKLTNMKSYKIQVIRGIAIVGVVLIHNTPRG